MKTVALRNLGRFGNRMFRYAHARALAEQNGWMLKTERWEGEKIFTLDAEGFAFWPEPDGSEDMLIDGYCQNQQSIIYSRADCRRWFKLKPEVEAKLIERHYYALPHAHFRRGDYAGAGYPLVSKRAVEAAMLQYGIYDPCVPVSDETPRGDPDFPGELSFLPDFYRLMRAPILFRANSSFSWWAAALGHGRVFSPIITGLTGGVEHDNVPFVEGNYPRLCELSFVTDLHLKES